MSYPRQLNQYKTGIHDPLWVIPNGALVDGVPNGISDGTGGVVLLTGFEGANNALVVDESRFGNNLAIVGNRGALDTTSPFFGSKVYANHPTDTGGLVLAWGEIAVLNPTISGSFMTAFTLEFFWRRSAVSTPHRADFGGINLASGTDNNSISLQDPGVNGYVIKRDFSNALFFAPVDALQDTLWHHFAIENKVPASGARTITFYVDGVSKVTRSVVGSVTAVTQRITIYTNQGNTPGQFYIDEMRLTKGMYRYGANFTPPTTGFIRG